MGAYREINFAIGNGLGHQRVGYRFRTVEYAVDDGLLIDGVLECFAYIDIFGNRLVCV